MLLASRSIELWLRSQIREGNKGLLERIIAGGTDLELQVNVSPRGGQPVHGKANTYTNGSVEWFSFRIPKGAATEPHWKDFPLRYNLNEHVDAIGCTGWNWRRKVSKWVGFDFDSIVGHAAGVGITDDQLRTIRDAVSNLPFVEVRKSTGGLGLHLYVLLDDIPCKNHTEHAAIGRCVLAKISEQVNMDLLTHVDACGGNMWIASRRATEENDGFGLIKPSETTFKELPANWKDHVAVVSRSRPRVSISGVRQSEEDMFVALTSSNRRVPLDEMHLKIRDALAAKGCAVWVQDHYLLQTHTKLLAQLHEELELNGVFETNSPGKNLSEPNCFGFPLENGCWKFYRFGQGTVEHRTWTQDGKSWTTCFYNRGATLEAAAAKTGGKLLANNGYEYKTLKQAVDAINLLNGGSITIGADDQELLTRKATLNRTKDGQLRIDVARTKDDGEDLENWTSQKKGHWSQIIPINAETSDKKILDYDNIIRCLETPSNRAAGWAVVKPNGQWTHKGASSIKTVLQAKGHEKPEAECLMGAAEMSPWRLVSIPFAPEYPGDRQWNLNAPQLRYKPAAPDDDDHNSPHPHWDLILDHVGSSLNDSLETEAWAQDAGVVTGAAYLKCWMASLIRDPFGPLPYLFLFGPENSGKSILHEAFSLLVTGGVVKADRSLTSMNEFNGELEGCVLAVVEEKNIAATPGAHNRIKDLVTSPTISIRRMRS
ncbi:MAG: primase-helicase family protein, partial [Aureliella sp.]